ncbi:glycosyltransferase [Vibrio fortis]|uniref:glycosyltransferase n=1 Tax=Vibrio fortis TaxID=212667 RepID=UPI004068FD2E
MNKPKILLVADKPNWAYDHMANYIISELGNKYEFSKIYAHYHKKKELRTTNYNIKQPARKLKALFYENYSAKIEYDIVVYLWWYIPEILDRKIKAKYELRGIFTESFPPGKTVDFNGDELDFIKRYIEPADGIIAGNKNIYDFYSKLFPSVYYATGATDINLFKPIESMKKSEIFNVCWTGNPHRNFKGFFDYVEPAVKLAQEKRPNIRLITRQKGRLATLPKFYSDVDLMVNASVGDAGPGFIIDAGACGVPTLSTNKGFASEIIKDQHNGYIVERDIKKIADKIVEIYDNRELLSSVSENIAKDIKRDWGHRSRAQYWDNAFKDLLLNEIK